MSDTDARTLAEAARAFVLDEAAQAPPKKKARPPAKPAKDQKDQQGQAGDQGLETTGDRVGHLQRRLTSLGYDLVDDGKFGPVTQSAVKDFQRNAILVPDGLVGPKTTAALQGAPSPDDMTDADGDGVPDSVETTTAATGRDVTAVNRSSGATGEMLYKGLGVGVTDADPRVAAMQQQMVAAGYPDLATDGRFGPETEKVVKRFQRKWGLRPDGMVGSKTRLALGDVGTRTNQLTEAVALRRRSTGSAFVRALAREQHLRRTLEEGWDAGRHPRGRGGQFAKGAGVAAKSHFSVEAGRDARTGKMQYERQIAGTHLGTVEEETEKHVRLKSGDPLLNGLRVEKKYLKLAEALDLEEANKGLEAMIAKLVAAGIPEAQAKAVAAKSFGGGGGKAGGLIGAKRGSKSGGKVIEMRRMPDGMFAPKGQGMVLKAGQQVSVPHATEKGTMVPGTATSVSQNGVAKIKLSDGPDKGKSWEALATTSKAPGVGVGMKPQDAGGEAGGQPLKDKVAAAVEQHGKPAGEAASNPVQGSSFTTPNGSEYKVTAVIDGKVWAQQIIDGKPSGQAAPISSDAMKNVTPPDAGAPAAAPAGAGPDLMKDPAVQKLAQGKTPAAQFAAGKTPEELTAVADFLEAQAEKADPAADEGALMKSAPHVTAAKRWRDLAKQLRPDAGASGASDPHPVGTKLATPMARGEITASNGGKYDVKMADGSTVSLTEKQVSKLRSGSMKHFPKAKAKPAAKPPAGEAPAKADPTKADHIAVQNGTAGDTDLTNSPGRGPTGKVRNFKAMSGPKLKNVVKELTSYGKDPEALKAAQAAAQAKGVAWGEPDKPGRKVAGKETSTGTHTIEPSPQPGVHKVVPKVESYDPKTGPSAEQKAANAATMKGSGSQAAAIAAEDAKIASSEAVKKQLAGIPAGTHVAVKLKDGTDLAGPIAGYGAGGDGSYTIGGKPVTGQMVASVTPADAPAPAGPAAAAGGSAPSPMLKGGPKAGGGKGPSGSAVLPETLSPNVGGYSLHELPLGAQFTLNDGSAYHTHKFVNDPWMIAKPVDGGKAKPFHKMLPPSHIGPQVPGYEGAAAGGPAAAPGAPAAGSEDLAAQLAQSVQVAKDAKAKGAKPSFKDAAPAAAAAPAANEGAAVNAALAAYQASGGADPAVIAALKAATSGGAGRMAA